MKGAIKKELKRSIFKRKTFWILLALLLIAIILAFYFRLKPAPCSLICGDFACFSSEMIKCSKAEYLNPESEAVWSYKIKGISDDKCRIEISISEASNGSLGLSKLREYKMDCLYPLGVSNYPGKDLTKCSGPLKEEMQALIIERMQTYIISQMGQLNESIRSIF